MKRPFLPAASGQPAEPPSTQAYDHKPLHNYLLPACESLLKRIDDLDDLKAMFVLKDSQEMGYFRAVVDKAKRGNQRP